MNRDALFATEWAAAGLAWNYKKRRGEQTPADRQAYAKAEDEAREAKRDLWADPEPIAPWDWRRGKRSVPSATEVPNPTVSPQGELPR